MKTYLLTGLTPQIKKTFGSKIRNIFIAGIAVFIPIIITIFILNVLVSWSDGLLKILPGVANPLTYIHIPGISLVIALVIIFIMGLMTYNYIGQKLLIIMEGIFAKIPFIKGIYSGAKQITEAFTEDKNKFSRVVLAEFPGAGSYAIGFAISEAVINNPEPARYLTVFIPTVPNPTSGFYLFVKQSNLYEINISVEEAFKIILTMGVGMNKPINAAPFIKSL